MKIMLYRTTRHLFLPIALLLTSLQANAVIFKWLRLSQLRQVSFLVRIATHGESTGHPNQITHILTTNLIPAAQATIPETVHFEIFDIPSGGTSLPIDSRTLQSIEQPQSKVQIDTQDCQSSLYEAEYDGRTYSPFGPEWQRYRHRFRVRGQPDLILGNYLTPGCMYSNLLSGTYPTNTHTTMGIIHNIVHGFSQPQLLPCSGRPTATIYPEQLFYTGPIQPQNVRDRLLGSQSHVPFTLHPFLPAGHENQITAMNPGLQVYTHNISGRGVILPLNSQFAQRGLILVNIAGFFVMAASDGMGGILAIVPAGLAIKLNWVAGDFSASLDETLSHLKRHDYDRGGDGGAATMNSH